MSKHALRKEFTAIIERDGKRHIGCCPETPGANGQGESMEECKKSLVDAIALILQDSETGTQRTRLLSRVGPRAGERGLWSIDRA